MRKMAACYCRVSTKKDEQLDSLEKQMDFFERFFERNEEYQLYKLYADEGVSAKSMRNRLAFAQMLQDAQEGRFAAVFVKDVSRFARNVRDFYSALGVLEEAGVSLHFVTMGLRSEPASRFTLGLMALLAQDESERLSVKVKFGKNVTAGRGRVPNFVFGYGRVDAFTLVPDPEQSEWVRRIFSMYVGEGLGAARIADVLNGAGVRTGRGSVGAWTQSSVCKLLKNPLYTGKVANKKSEVADFRTGSRTNYPPERWVVCEREAFRIIDDQTFAAAQEILRERAAAFTASTRHSGAHPLSNLLRCAQDGRCMRRIARDASWVCSVRNARGVSACQNAAKVNEAQLVARLERLARDSVAREAGAPQRIGRRVEEILKGRGAAAPIDLGALRAKELRLMGLYAEGLLSKEELDGALVPIRDQRQREETRVSAQKNVADRRIQIQHMVTLYLRGERPFADNAYLKRWIDCICISPDGRMELALRSGACAPLK